MRVKKILLVLCILLLASPSWAVEAYFSHEHYSFEVSELEGFPGQTESISGGEFSPATLPLIEGITGQIAPAKLQMEINPGSYVFGWYEFRFSADDVPEMNYSLVQDDINNIFNYVRPVLSVGTISSDNRPFDIYGFLAFKNKENMIQVSGSFQDGFFIRIPIIFSDEAEPPGYLYFKGNYLCAVDGEVDGYLNIGSYIGIKAPPAPIPELDDIVLNTSKIKLTLRDVNSFLDLEKVEVDFSDLGAFDWPGHSDVLDAICVGSFEGTYSGAGQYSPLDVEISVTGSELSNLSSNGYNAVVNSWTKDKKSFFDRFHVYKQISAINIIEDLVTMGGKEAFTLSGDPTTEVTISFPMILIDDNGSSYYSEDVGFVIYDGERDGKLVDPLFVGALEEPETPETPEEPSEEDGEVTKHLLPGNNPAGSSTGHEDLDKWITIFSLF